MGTVHGPATNPSRREQEEQMALRQFGELEAVVMDAVWSADGPLTVRNVHDDLKSARQIAYTTVMSTMDNLYRKGWLRREKVGLAYHYRPIMSREEHSAKLMRTVFQSGGDSELILNFFLDQIGDDDSGKLRTAFQRLATGRSS
jgi:predicted transcriptional regulator